MKRPVSRWKVLQSNYIQSKPKNILCLLQKPIAKEDGKRYYVRGGAWNIDFEKTGYEMKKMTYTVNELPGTKVSLILK